MLRTMVAAIDAAEALSVREVRLRHVAQTVARRMIVVVVTDEAPLGERTERELKRLRAQHDVLWVTLRDADPVLATASAVPRRDVASRWSVPEFLQGDPAIVAELHAERAAADAHRTAVLDRLAVTHTILDGENTVIAALLAMLHRRSHARR